MEIKSTANFSRELEKFKKEIDSANSDYFAEVEKANKYAVEYKNPLVEEAQKKYSEKVELCKKNVLAAIDSEKEKAIDYVFSSYFKPIDIEVLNTLNLIEQVKPTEKELQLLANKYNDQPLVLRRLEQIRKVSKLQVSGLSSELSIDSYVDKIESNYSLAMQGIQSFSVKKPSVENLTFTMVMKSLEN